MNILNIFEIFIKYKFCKIIKIIWIKVEYLRKNNTWYIIEKTGLIFKIIVF